ncbi:hypothetical protein D3C71_2209310 [compost metagenome]
MLGLVDKVLMLREGCVQLCGTRDEVFATLRQANVMAASPHPVASVGAGSSASASGRE